MNRLSSISRTLSNFSSRPPSRLWNENRIFNSNAIVKESTFLLNTCYHSIGTSWSCLAHRKFSSYRDAVEEFKKEAEKSRILNEQGPKRKDPYTEEKKELMDELYKEQKEEEPEYSDAPYDVFPHKAKDRYKKRRKKARNEKEEEDEGRIPDPQEFSEERKQQLKKGFERSVDENETPDYWSKYGYETDPITLKPKLPPEFHDTWFEDNEVKRVLDKANNGWPEWRYNRLNRVPFHAPWNIRTPRNPYVWIRHLYRTAKTRVIPFFGNILLIITLAGFVYWLISDVQSYQIVLHELPEREDQYAMLFEATKFTLREYLAAWIYYLRDIRDSMFYALMLSKPLLPLQYPANKYVVVLDLESLVHEVYSWPEGIMCKKRSGLDYFMAQLSQGPFEVVVYSSRPYLRVQHLLPFVDPSMNIVSYWLSREDCHKIEGDNYIKDVRMLNRRPEMVVMLDGNQKQSDFVGNRENCIQIPEWDGESQDTTLLNVLKVFYEIASKRPPDVRGQVKELREGGLERYLRQDQRKSGPLASKIF
eukprot:TRINITY_DN5897_c0_g1_i1.p1 TRINITY_DN5897_c0_g1~~TRINITY_DN5897_c0_g1_i1.p1  ORF type:complete len:533 (+),score=90.38 TRINITY_DN5897_c0_g1_i1:85-1683(+)